MTKIVSPADQEVAMTGVLTAAASLLEEMYSLMVSLVHLIMLMLMHLHLHLHSLRLFADMHIVVKEEMNVSLAE